MTKNKAGADCHCHDQGEDMAPRGKRAVKRTPPVANSVSRLTADVEAMDAAVQESASVAMAATAKARRLSTAVEQGTQKLAQWYERAKNQNSRVRTAGIDAIATVSSQVSFEAINWLFRRLSKYWPWMAENIDYFQSVPHLLLGMGVYWSELLTRENKVNGLKSFPSMPREIARQWSLVFTALGFNNLWRAMGVRRKDVKAQLSQFEAVKAERDAMAAELAKLEKK